MRKIYDYLGKIELFLSQIFLVTIAILVFIAGVSRSLRNPIYWANPLASFLFAWTVFLATDAAFRQNKLMSVDFLVKKLPERVQSIIRLINYVIILGFLVYLIIFGIQAAYDMRFRTHEGMYGFSYFWVTISVPFGALLLLFTTIYKIKDEINFLKGRI
ncbi:MAG: TRAP transporter small permease [Dictyoglomaceae bacterium]